MELSELRTEAIKNGESRIQVSKAINPLIRHYRHHQSSLKDRTPRLVYKENRELPAHGAAGGVSLDSPPTVEWYVENIRDIDPYDLASLHIRNFGPKSKAFVDYLVDTYYAPGPEIDMYERPLGYDY